MTWPSEEECADSGDEFALRDWKKAKLPCELIPGSPACLTKTWPREYVVNGRTPCQSCQWWDEFCGELMDVD